MRGGTGMMPQHWRTAREPLSDDPLTLAQTVGCCVAGLGLVAAAGTLMGAVVAVVRALCL